MLLEMVIGKESLLKAIIILKTFLPPLKQSFSIRSDLAMSGDNFGCPGFGLEGVGVGVAPGI